MKKLFSIRYTWRNEEVQHESSHFEDVYYLCRNISEALNDIQNKFSDESGVEVKIVQFEEISYKQIQ